MSDAAWERDLSKHAVILDLHGSKAPHGVELDAFQTFLKHFRGALRDFERSRSKREQVGRSGRPKGVSETLTGFRLVRFREGSGIVAIEPLEQYEGEAEAGEPAPTRNLRLLMADIKAGEPVPLQVTRALQKARSAIGDDGSYGVRFRSQANGKVTIDSEAIARLIETAQREPEPEQQDLVVSGILHLIEVHEPIHVAIRSANGVEWACTYDETLKPKLKSLLEDFVWATGSGRQVDPRRGELHVDTVQGAPKLEDGSLFTMTPIPADELARRQGVHAPQGLKAVGNPEWVDDEPGRAYLDFILGDDDDS